MKKKIGGSLGRLRAISIGFFVLSLTGCEDGKELQGRYQGTYKYGESVTQVVAQVPNFVSKDKKKILQFKTYETLASSKGTAYRITVLDDKNILLNTDYLPEKGVRLVRKDTCASGKSGDLAISACWSEGKLDFEFVDKADPAKSISVHLVRNDELPPAKNPTGPNRIYTLDELMGRAKFLNYSVSIEAERVYQARQNIGVARGNLLPKLNLKSILGILTGDYISSIGNLLPFLFPNNWFKWKQSKALFQAERNSFASLRGNEMNATEGLFYLILRDQLVLNRLKKQITWMKETQVNLEREELRNFGKLWMVDSKNIAA